MGGISPASQREKLVAANSIVNPRFLATRKFRNLTHLAHSPCDPKNLADELSCGNCATQSARVNLATSFGYAAVETEAAR